MTLDEQGALFAERHSAHLQVMTGSMSAQVLDLLARLDTANAHARSLEDENKALITQRDEALHMQAETMKTVEQSGAVIEELQAAIRGHEANYEKMMHEHTLFVQKTMAQRKERNRAAQA